MPDASPARCHDCDLPLATQADYDATPEGRGAHLCWRDWNSDRCVHPPVDWRSRALKAEAAATQLASEHDVARSRLDGFAQSRIDEIKAMLTAPAKGKR